MPEEPKDETQGNSKETKNRTLILKMHLIENKEKSSSLKFAPLVKDILFASAVDC